MSGEESPAHTGSAPRLDANAGRDEIDFALPGTLTVSAETAGGWADMDFDEVFWNNAGAGALTIGRAEDTVQEGDSRLRPSRSLRPHYSLEELMGSSSLPAAASDDPISTERAARNAQMRIDDPADTTPVDLLDGPRLISALPFPIMRPTAPAENSAGRSISQVWQSWSDRHSPPVLTRVLDLPPRTVRPGAADPADTTRLLGLAEDRVAARREARERTLAAIEDGSAAAGRLAQARRRRRRVLNRLDVEDMSMDDHTVEEGMGLERYPWSSLMDYGSEDDEWSGRPLYEQFNLTGDDINEWTTTLRRGSNNRRRISLARRQPGPLAAEAPQQPDAEPVAFDRSTGGRAGLRPTNLARPRPVPTVVGTSQSAALAAPAAPSLESAVSGEREGSDRPSKKRRLNPHAPEFRPASSNANKVTPSEPLTRPTYLSYTTTPHDLPLPNAFIQPLRRSHLALTTTKRGRSVYPVITFTSHPLPSGTEADACALRTSIPVPTSCGVFYYEIEVLDQGLSGLMSMGFMSEKSDLGRLVGWDKGTYGYHADDGRSFEGQPSGLAFAEQWGIGDVIGCGVDFTSGRAFFTKNGRMLGHRFSKLGEGLYPAIGLRTLRESLMINFNGPFRYDIDRHVRDVRDSVWREATAPRPPMSDSKVIQIREAATADDNGSPERLTVKGEKIPSPKETTRPLLGGRSARLEEPGDRAAAAFVADYLQHHGFSSTLRKMRSKMEQRQWVTSTTSSSASNPEWNAIRRMGFDNPEAAISEAGRLVRQGQYPQEILEALLPAGAKTDAPMRDILRAVEVHHFWTKLRDADALGNEDVPPIPAEDEPAPEALAAVVQDGRDLKQRCQAEGWASAEADLLAEVFGLLGTPSSAWPEDVAHRWAKRGEANEAALTAALRSVCGLKSHSYLETAFAQATQTTRLLAQRTYPPATFIDVRRVLEDKEAFSPRPATDDKAATPHPALASSQASRPKRAASVSSAPPANTVQDGAGGADQPLLRRNDSRRNLRALL